MHKLLDVLTALAATCAVVGTVAVFWNRTPTGRVIHTQRAERVVPEWPDYVAAGHRVGPDSAIVTIVEFGDYQCPACRGFHGIVSAFQSAHPNEVAFVYRHWPLPQHPLAYFAARASECAGDQGAFFGFHDYLYETTTWLAEPLAAFRRYATLLELDDLSTFEDCVLGVEPHAVVEQDIAAVLRLDAWGTPTVLINGILLGSVPDSTTLEAILLNRKRTGDR